MPVAFRVSSPLAMFRKWWTTTSSISYAFPPPTAVAGLISAILGFEKSDDNRALYWEKVTGCISVVIERYSFINMGLNFINTKNNKEHTQIMHQFLRNPSYVILYKGPLEEELKNYLSRGYAHFTPYLGVAYAITAPEFLGVFGETVTTRDYVDSVYPYKTSTKEGESEEVPSVDISRTQEVFLEKVDLRLDISRRKEDTVNVLYSKGRIYFKGKVEVNVVGEYSVKWFPCW